MRIVTLFQGVNPAAKKNRLLVFLLTLTALLPQITYAAPAVTGVSGTVNHGSQITISGSNFGSKAQAAPFKYDSFEAGATNQPVTGWSQNNNNSVSYSTAYTRGASAKVAKHNGTGGNYNMSLGMDGVLYPYLYVDFWMRVDPVDGTNNPSRNFKPWRFYGTGGADPQVDYVVGSDQGALTNLCDGPCEAGWASNDTQKTGWRHYQIIVKESSASGVADGTFRHFINSVAQGHNRTNVVTRRSNGHYGQVRIGHYWATDSPSNSGANIYTDDIYIDTTWARVEIGNAPTYAASTIREIQIPSAWSTGSITMTVNRGSFGSGQQAYLYVFDANGDGNSSGHPIVFGSGGATTPPPAGISAPKGLRIASQ